MAFEEKGAGKKSECEKQISRTVEGSRAKDEVFDGG